MSAMGPTVNEACELLHEALKDQVARVRGEVARVSAVDDYAAARAALTRAEQLDALLADLAELQKRAHALTGGASGATEPEASLPERVGQRPPRLQRGLRTPKEAYRVPILRALVEKGGRARVKDVLASVHADIVERLNDYDYQPVPSDSRRPRWVNGAMWCRKQLCEQGLLRADSPWGVWEITESGRRWLEEQA